MASTIVTPGPASSLVATGQPMPLQPGEFAPSQPANLVTFGLEKVAPPSPLYIQRDDVLGLFMMTAFSNAVVTFTGRFLRAADGVVIPFALTLKSAGQDQIASTTESLGEGYLLSLSASGNSGSTRGGTFVQAFLIRGALSTSPLSGVQQVLFADYVSQNTPTGWPGGRIIHNQEGTGRVVATTGSNPAAGADFVFNTPSNQVVLWRPLYLEAQLVTSATVANRVPTFQLGSAQFVKITATTAVVASQTAKFILMPGNTPYTDGNTNYHLPLPIMGIDVMQDLQLFSSSTAGIQAGDQWSSIVVRYADLRSF